MFRNFYFLNFLGRKSEIKSLKQPPVGFPVSLNTDKGKYLNNVEFRVTDCTVKERQTPANSFTIFDYTKEDQCFNQECFHIHAYF